MTNISDMILGVDSDMLEISKIEFTIELRLVMLVLVAELLCPHWFHVCPSSRTTSIHCDMNEYLYHRGNGCCRGTCRWLLVVALVEGVSVGTIHGTNVMDYPVLWGNPTQSGDGGAGPNSRF